MGTHTPGQHGIVSPRVRAPEMRLHAASASRVGATLRAWLAATALVWGAAVGAQTPPATNAPPQTELQAKARALARAHAAVVGLRSVAVEDAVSIRSLGRQRQGSGVVIDDDGSLVLTIGYLVLEAEQVEIQLDGGRSFPARVVAYDQATGFGLVQSLAPLPLPSVPFGRSSTLETSEPLMIASGGSDGDLSLARLVSRRAFSGYWEYHIEGALFTAPPRGDHSGAALFNADGELLGIGSLVVADALGQDAAPMTGNMFVPIDLLKPILAELRERGSSRLSHRPWMGVNCVAREGQVRVLRVTDDSPAEAAGLRPGDHIVAVDGTPVGSLEAFYKALWAGSSPEREVRLDVRRAGEARGVTVQAVDRERSLRKARGI